jgi:glutaminyl-tRNA synthetase
MAVLDPLKLVLTNYPAELAEEMNAVNNPENPAAGSRKIPFSRELYIEREDFMEDAPKKYHRLTPGQEVRLRYGYIVRCTSCVKDPATGVVTEVHATYDPATRGGDAPDGRKIRGTIHWVPAAGSVECEARMFDRLFTCEQPENVPEGVDFKDNLNPASMKTCRARVEPMLATAQPGSRYQFERKGYFHADPVDSRPGAPVFNLIATLRDSWSKTAQST